MFFQQPDIAPVSVPGNLRPPWRLWGKGGRLLVSGDSTAVWGAVAATTARPLVVQSPSGIEWQLEGDAQ
jgi:hypothetical protein